MNDIGGAGEDPVGGIMTLYESTRNKEQRGAS